MEISQEELTNLIKTLNYAFKLNKELEGELAKAQRELVKTMSKKDNKRMGK